MSGLQHLFELSDFGKRYSRYILEEIASQTPSVNKIKELLAEFQTLNAKIGQPYEPFYRAGQAINVDGETIAFSRIPRELDWYHGRATRNASVNSEEYWNKQLRMAREEAVTMMHAFDVEPAIEENRTNLPEHTEERRIAHQMSIS